MRNSIAFWILSIIASVLLFMIAITVFDNTIITAPIIMTISLFLFVGSIVKLCKLNATIKNIVVSFLKAWFDIP